MNEHELTPEERESSAHGARDRIGELYEWVEWFAGVVILAVMILAFLGSTVVVYGASMERTLLEGDRLVVTRLGGFDNGDIVAIVQPNDLEKPLVKRIIASGGQVIDIDFQTGDVTIDGALQTEPYIRERTYVQYDLEFPLTVPEGCVFAMGDNRNESWDSRASDIGMIDERYVLGKAVFRFAPVDRIGKP